MTLMHVVVFIGIPALTLYGLFMWLVAASRPTEPQESGFNPTPPYPDR